MSLWQNWGKYRAKMAFAQAWRPVAAGSRVVTWGGFFKWTAIAVLALPLAAAVMLYFLDWNWMRGPIGRYLSQRSGREVRIDGDLTVDLFTWQPRIDAHGLYVGNPSWAAKTRPHAALVRELKLELRLVPLLFGELILPLVWIDHPDLLVVRESSGRSNWDGPHAGDDKPFQLPPIHRFVIQQGHVEIDDAMRKLKFTGTVSSSEGGSEGGKGAGFALTGDGALNADKFLADVKGGPLLNVDAAKPYDFTVDVRAGQTHAIVRGAIAQPFHLDRFTATVNVTGANLSELYYLTGLALPGTPPYRLRADVARNGQTYRLTGLSGEFGNSDISGELMVDAAGKVPMLRGQLQSRTLSFDDLGALVGGGRNALLKSRYLLPDTVLHTERLRQMDAQVDYSATSVKSRDFPLTSLITHIGLERGVLDLDPLAFGFTAGKLSGKVRIDAQGEVPVTGVDARLTDVQVEHFIPGKDKPVTGVMEARAQLTGRGNSVHQVASAAAGTFTTVIPSGHMQRSLAEWLGVDVISALGLTLSGDESKTNLRCAVAHFEVKDGVMTAQRLVLDTDPVRVDGSGQIDLKDETVDLRLQGAPKSFQLVRLRAPVTVGGPLASPGIGVDLKPMVAQGGIGAALTLLNPFAAIFAFVDPGLAKDANCAALLTTAKSQGVPTRKSGGQR